jgi:acid phosphatase (class A)
MEVIMKHIIIRKTARYAVVLFIFTLLCIALTGGTSGAKQVSVPDAVKEIAPGLLEGYLAHDALPNSLELLPPPPEEGSAGFALDEDVSQQSFAARDTARWEQAIQDANLEFPAAIDSFAAVLEIPITEEDTPHLYMLLRRTLTDVGLSTYAAKTHYNRSRPFMKNGQPICTPADEEGLRKDGSYPSGHTAIGWAWALLLCEISPEHSDALLQRGWEFGQSRIICNVHWQSDVNQGRIMGAATVARLHADPGFLADLQAAKIEVATVLARN